MICSDRTHNAQNFITFSIIVFIHTEVTEALNAPAQYPGCTGTRNLSDNISDLRAQVAANQKVYITRVHRFRL